VLRRARTYGTGVSLVVMLSLGLTACSGSSDDGTGGDSKPGTSTPAAPPAEPGKYSTLPDPCDAVGHGTLKRLLPGAEAVEASGAKNPGASASPFEGEPAVTYDTDRRAGCRWKSATSLATRHLSVDLERVVSYDPAVSDDEQAQQVYDERASSAGFPTGGDGSSTPPESEQGEQGDEGGQSEKDGSDEQDGQSTKNAEKKSAKNAAGSEKPDSGKNDQPADEEEEAAGASPSPEEELAPRILDDIGDNAYIDDQLDTSDSGVHRDITLVFRSANVLVTVKYDQWLTDKRRSPDSAELQEKARSVAEELAADFDDN
jgi:hypothetical protein